jgi:antitoxin ParD1/3/4
MNVLLNPELEKLISQKLESGEYPTAEAVVEEGLRLLNVRDSAEARVEALLLEAEESGPATEMTGQEWDDIRREVRESHARSGPQ